MSTTKQQIGQGITAEVQGEQLILRVDLTAHGERSRSGKTLIVASTRGAASVGDHQVNLNVYRHPKVG